MKWRISVAFLVIFAGLGFRLSAQDQPSRQQLQAWQKTTQDKSQTPERLREEKQKMAREMLLIDTNKNGITLFLGIGEDGKVTNAVMRQPNRTIKNVQKLQIEMEDGVIHDVVIDRIRSMTVH